MSSKLDAALEGVAPVTPPAEPTPPEPKDGKQGRGPDEVRGELLRKMEESNAALRAEIAASINGLKGMIEGAVATRPAKPRAGMEALDGMSVQELRAMRGQIQDTAQQAALDEYIANRVVDERVDARLTSTLSARQFAETERAANEEATSRWPELRDKSSRLYAETNRIINEMGTGAETDPRAVLHAANEAGFRLGIAPKAPSARLAYDRHGQVAPGHDANAPGPGSADEKLTPEDEAEVDRVAERLGAAMPAGKFSPEQLARVKKNLLEYRKNAHLFIKK
jgi:hypothetical protein